MELIGQIIGVIATTIFFFSYQVKDKKLLLTIQTIGTAVMCVQYLLLSAWSGFALSIVCIIRNLLFFQRHRKFLSGRWLPFAMAVVMAVTCAFSWEGWPSLLFAGGLMINTVCLGFCQPKGLLKSILVTSPMVLIYLILIFSVGGIANELITITSAAIGLYRWRKVKEAE